MNAGSLSNVPVITVDGPSGVGKGTVSSYLAERLQWHYLDSGALYRIVGYAATQASVNLDDGNALKALMKDIHIGFEQGAHLNGDLIEPHIRTEMAGEHASRVAKHPAVRAAMLGLQQGFCQPPGLVADGRDMGTVIFPKAAHKFYLIADAEMRAKRRCKQLLDAETGANIAALFQGTLKDIQRRDERDMNRQDSPLRPAVDAVIIDTSHLCIDEVLEEVLLHLSDII